MARLTRRALLSGIAAAAAVPGLAACGYRPMYGGGARRSPVARQLGQISVGVIPERYGQILRNSLERAFAAAGRGGEVRYALSVTPRLTSASLGIEKDATATRANLSFTADYRLAGPEGQVLFADSVTAITSYNILDDQYATVISREDAERRAARDVAQRIVSRLSAFFAERGSA